MTLKEKINVLKANKFELSEFPDFQSDKDIVLVAIQYDSRNLQYASEKLKRDDDILSAAIDNLDSEYWRRSKVGGTYDVDRFLDDMGIGIDVLKGKSKTAEALVDSGYFDYDNYYDQGLNKPRLGYKDVFGDNFVSKISENGMQLEGIEEFEKLQSEYLDLDYELNNEIDYDEDYVDYCKVRAKQVKIRHRMAYIEAKCAEWSKTASVLERISINSIVADGTTIGELRVGPVGASLEEVLNDTEIMSNEDLKRKFELFQEKCIVKPKSMNIECEWKKEQDGKLICTKINGASETINDNCKITSIDFETGNIRNYANSIREDWIVDEDYIDETIIDSKLASQTHDIEEIVDIASQRRLEDINKVISEVSEAMKDKTKDNEQTR